MSGRETAPTRRSSNCVFSSSQLAATDVRDGISAVGESGRRIPVGHSNADRRKSRCRSGVTWRERRAPPRACPSPGIRASRGMRPVATTPDSSLRCSRSIVEYPKRPFKNPSRPACGQAARPQCSLRESDGESVPPANFHTYSGSTALSNFEIGSNLMSSSYSSSVHDDGPVPAASTRAGRHPKPFTKGDIRRDAAHGIAAKRAAG